MKAPEQPLAHGGDWAGYEQAYGSAPLDFSSNVSPLGLPEGVQKAVLSALPDAGRYPDPLCRALRGAIAQAEGVDPAWCLCGGGAADLIYRVVLARRPRRALVTAPTFSEYEAALDLVSCQVTHVTLRRETGFLLQPESLKAMTPDLDLVFLCEPNNPTGRTTPRPLLLEILARCRERNIVLVVDECFGGFLDCPASHTLCGYLEEFPNLLVLKAFTKAYAMAGLRLGYCLCRDTALLETMRQAGQPWPVSGLAQTAGIAALKEHAYLAQVRTAIQQERPWLKAALEELGCMVIPGEANYLLFSSPLPLLESLAQRGILLRSCANYRGLDGSWYRTAVHTHGENQQLIAALTETLRGYVR